MDGRPPTSAGNRPGSGLRPMSSMRNSSNLTLPSRSGIPGTASRLITASNNRPGTRSGFAHGVGVLSHINVVDRPMSQQGLVTPRTGVRTLRRQVQDKSYFMGLLRSKVNELSTEINRLNKELDLLTKEQSTYLTYEKRAEGQALELKSFQGQLADYNLLVDKLNTDAEMADVQQEYKELKMQNETEAQAIDSLFEQRQEREAQLAQLESEITQERYVAENLTSTMSPELRKEYNELKKTDNDLQRSLEKLQQDLDLLISQKMSLEEELSLSQIKQEALALYNKLREVEEKRDALLLEEKSKGTPAQERENLVQQVKEHNTEITSIERQLAEIRELISRGKNELEQIDQELEDNQGERISKYRELKKREETMDSFLSTFDENQTTSIEKKIQLESTVVSLLEKLSRNIGHFHHIPSPQELALLKDDLQFKEGEMEKSRMTVMTLNNEQKKLAMDLTKIEQLETKIQQELETLQQKITSMEKEMIVYSDLGALKTAAEEKKDKLIEEDKILKKQKEYSKKVVGEINTLYETQKNKLNDNETYTQLCNLERRWQYLEQNNFAMLDFIASKKAQTDYSKGKQCVKETLALLNDMLQEPVLQR
ncbi:intraflagellar transport protein 74 homolog [Parasteatoda tepidariorum]|uniref:intraflagellar transport protein 74 homolog n=1 Tax=Parasteatoda tepidariorum TaxID=114398 RepID=UPI001C7251D5|nr:intraflagellar transport protein 74 homolog [Parasteatoda tepidariorum]